MGFSLKKKSKRLIKPSFLLIFFCLSLCMPYTQAIPTDSYYFSEGDWAIYQITHNSLPYVFPLYNEVGHEFKIEILAINGSVGSDFGDFVLARFSNSSATNSSWDLFYEDIYLRYNLSDAGLTSYGGFLVDSYVAVCPSSCKNLTAYHLYLNYTYFNIPGDIYNTSSRSGLTFSIWNGSNDGTPSGIGARKIVFTLHPMNYIIQTTATYNCTDGSTWEQDYGYTMVQNSWTEPDCILLLIFIIIIVILSILAIGIYYHKKRKK